MWTVSAQLPPATPAGSPWSQTTDPRPPPPPAPPGSEGEDRATAATWVAATGALLLLAAAATFLAVSWDTMGLAARVTVVGAATGTAILGGHRLRRRLPAVGSVVFHLGALLLPVDALGLALQTGLPLSGRWLAVGLVAAAPFPPLAVAGRSNVLGWAGVAGVPVAATGAALAGVVEARIAVVAVAVAALALQSVAAGRLAAVRRGAAPVLAVLAATLPAAVAALSAVPRTGGAIRHLEAAGWAPGTWTTTIAVGTAAITVIGLAAVRHRSTRLATVACFTAVTTVATALLPTGTPRLAMLLVPALAALGVEVAALTARSDRLWAAPTGRLAGAVETIGAVLAGQVLAMAAVPWFALDRRPDTDLAVTLGVLALVWSAASVRHGLAGGRRAGLAPALAGSAGIHVAALLAAAGSGSAASVLLLVALASATLAWSGSIAVPGGRTLLAGTTDAARHVAAVTAAVLLAAAALRAVGSAVGAAVPLAVASILGGHVRAALRAHRRVADPLIATMTPLAVGLVLLTTALAAVTGSDAVPFAWVLAAIGLLMLASLLDERPWAADAVRVVAAGVGFAAVLPGWPAVVSTVGTGPADTVMILFGFGADGLVPSLLVACWLTVDALRLQRPRIAAFAAPVFVRLVGILAVAVGLPLSIVGAVLWTGAVAAAVTATIAARRWRAAAVTAAVVAGPAGWLLVGDDPGVRAVLLIASGSLVAAAGALRRRPVVGHLGATVATVGIWQLLVLHDVVALDIWLAPVATQLWAAGIALRRREGASSWITDVPPLMLLAVPAIVERVAGGPGWHAVLAGGVALLAVVVGGAGRLGGPLFCGTLLMVALVGIETFAVVAAVPTWAWLAVGGATLLGAAVVIERSGGSPATAARRLVDVVGERFH